jgi:hypothetical protein
MLKTLMLALTLLVSAAWLQAQQYPQSGSGQTGNTTSRQTKVEGCLQGSNGNFTLTDSSGTAYQLPRNSCFLSRWNSDELVSQGGGFPLELLDL